MSIISGRVYNACRENNAIEGCTVSEEIFGKGEVSVVCFCLDANTDISAETYEYPKLMTVLSGCAETFGFNGTFGQLKEDKSISVPTGVPTGVRAKSPTVYTEINFGSNIKMNDKIKTGEVFSLKDIVPYENGKIVNMDVATSEKTKFVVMSFDEGKGLSEHAAPGDALIFALDGKGIIGYEGSEYSISAGENFRFAKGGKHYVKADGKFKMALLLTLE